MAQLDGAGGTIVSFQESNAVLLQSGTQGSECSEVDRHHVVRASQSGKL
jgi:hypothetical protein